MVLLLGRRFRGANHACILVFSTLPSYDICYLFVVWIVWWWVAMRCHLMMFSTYWRYLVEHTSALDRMIIRNPLVETPSTGRSNHLEGGSNRHGQEHRWKLKFATPRGTPSGTMHLGLSWGRKATQNFLNYRRDKGGEQWGLEKLGFGENKVKLIMSIGWWVSISHDPLYL
jgi:hypothetical protein